MPDPPKYKIHPAIGIARLGGASSFFIGPEIPGFPPLGDKPGTSVPPYKQGGLIKPQAARFRIFEYVDVGGKYTVKREITLSQKDVDVIEWTVHLANRKASFRKFARLADKEGRVTPYSGWRNSKDVAPSGSTLPQVRHVGPRKLLEIDPGERKITGRSKGPVEFNQKNPKRETWPTPAPVPPITTLGRLFTDDQGRAVVIGGSGVSSRRPSPGSYDITNYANNDGWFDDVSDGPVTAFVRISGKVVAIEPAWVICAPPDFAPVVKSLVTLYDVLYDIAARELTLPSNESTYVSGPLKRLGELNADFKSAKGKSLKKFKPDFNSEIFPILVRAASMKFVYGPAAAAHQLVTSSWSQLASPANAAKSLREAIFGYLRHPNLETAAGSPRNMPKLLGDEPDPLAGGINHKRYRATLTITQYQLMKRWAAGDFVGSSGPPGSAAAPPLSPEGLDRAALESCVGAGMCPGIEASWQIRYASIYKDPFRIDPSAKSPYPNDRSPKIRAGYFTRQMALPWQADFRMCKIEPHPDGEFGWWPSQRPDDVYVTSSDFSAGKPSVAWSRSTQSGGIWPSSASTLPSDAEMLANWQKFGFVVDQGGIPIEQERDSSIP